MSFVSSRMSRMNASRVSLRCSISRKRNSHSPVSSGLVNSGTAFFKSMIVWMAFGLERLAFHARNACGVLVLCRRKEHRHEALRNHVEERALVIVERTRDGAGRNNCKVIRYFRVVKDALVWLDPIVIEHFSSERI